MEILKRKFLTLDIRGQIQFGTMGVAVCVCYLIFSIVILSCFVIISSSYVDVLDVIDKSENEGLEAMSLYISTQIAFDSDISKAGVQWLNNYIGNMQRLSNFPLVSEDEISRKFINLNKFDPLKYQNCINSVQYKCFYYQNFNDNYDLILSDSEFVQIVNQAVPLLDFLINLRFNDYPTLNNFEKVTILSPNLNLLFSYPVNYLDKVNKLNTTNSLSPSYITNYSKLLIEDYVQLLQESLNKQSDDSNYFTQNNYNFYSSKSLDMVIDTSPGIVILDKLTLNNVSIYTDQGSNKKTYSIKVLEDKRHVLNLNTSLYNLSQNLTKILGNSVDYFVLGQWTEALIDQMEKDLVFKQIQIIMTKNINKTEYMFSEYGCKYFLQLYMINNLDIKINSTGKQAFTDCFPHQKAQDNLPFLINLPFWMLGNYKRKFKFPLFAFHDASSTRDINYKIFKNAFPDNYTIKLLNSDFMIFNSFYYYVLKNTRYTEIQCKYVLDKFVSILFVIILVNSLVWLIVQFIIFFIMNKILINLTTPIKMLIHNITQIGMISDDSSENESSLDLDKICYHDDKDIDEVFTLCKDLIKGGFKIISNQRKEQETINFLSSINNISEIKTNNLKLDEAFIIDDYNQNVKDMMNFLPKKIIGKKEVRKEDYLKLNSPNSSEDEEESRNDFCNTGALDLNSIALSSSKSMEFSGKNMTHSSMEFSPLKRLIHQSKFSTSLGFASINLPENDREIAAEYSSRLADRNLLYSAYSTMFFRYENPYPSKYYHNVKL